MIPGSKHKFAGAAAPGRTPAFSRTLQICECMAPRRNRPRGLRVYPDTLRKMTEQTQQPDAAAAANGPAPEPARASVPKLQPVLVAAVVAAIILAIAIVAFWTMF
jgi:hypothetical protein